MPHAQTNIAAPVVPVTQLTVPSETVCAIILKARSVTASDAPPDSKARQGELADMIDRLGGDEQTDLVALARLGRGDGEVAEWHELREEAPLGRDRAASRYLVGLALLGDYLEVGLDMFGCDCSDLQRQAS